MSEHYSETVAAMLEKISGLKSTPDGAYNFRLDGKGEERKSSDHIKITAKTDKPGIDIRIADGTVNEKAFIPVVLTKSGLEDLVYNDFFIGENCDVHHHCGLRHPQLTAARTRSTMASTPSMWAKIPRCPMWRSTMARATATGGRILNPSDHRLSGRGTPLWSWTPARSAVWTPPSATPRS